MKLPKGHSTRWFIVSIILFIIGFIIFIPESLSSQPTVQTAKYDYTGPHMFSGWAIIRSDQHPSRVTANNTGPIPEYLTLKALNATIIGMHWDGNNWQNLTQTGWYWDSNHSLLYLHFQTWNNDRYHVTEISVEVPVAAASTVTVTQTVTVTDTVTVTQTITVTSTVTETQTTIIWVTTTVTTTRTCTIVCLP